MKHKYANLIHEWAEGATVQYRIPLHDTPWQDCSSTPHWDNSTMEFRIKRPQWQLDIITAIKSGKTVEVLVAKDTWVTAAVLKNLVKTNSLDLYSWQPEKDYRIKNETVYMWAYLIDGDWYAQAKLMTELQARTELLKTAGVEKIKKLHTFPNP